MPDARGSDPANEELDAWAAEKVMGWHLAPKTKVQNPLDRVWRNVKGDWQFKVRSWHPTAEGSEHQAMMVAGKMQEEKDQFFTLTGPDPKGTHQWIAHFRRPNDGMGFADTLGRAILLAAWRAAEGEKQG